MLRVVIIEDEKHAVEKLNSILARMSDVRVVKTIASVGEGIAFFNSPVEADLVFSDVQLTDGLSFDIFRTAGIRLPVIFITGYNEYMINAFNYNGIDYLLKPVEQEDIQKALVKYQMLKDHFVQNLGKFSQLIKLYQPKKTRLLVRRGIEHFPILLEDIVLFYTEDKVVYVFHRNGTKYFSDYNLTRLESELDGRVFFRANRQYIININYVRGFKAFDKVKLQVDLKLADTHSIIISQETAPEFRKWLNEA